MHILKSIIIAFSMYSKIPMPQFEWKEEDMKHVLCFFPWIGIVIGLCLYFWRLLCDRFGIRNLCYVFIGTAIPLLLTGGFHVDGFMDTMDAFHSYQPKERKLEILKDSHIGAFAVIMLAVYGLIYMGAFSEITDKNILQVVCAGFVLARVLSGIGVVSFPSAKKEGMLYLFQDHADAVIVKQHCLCREPCASVLCCGGHFLQEVWRLLQLLQSLAIINTVLRRNLGGLREIPQDISCCYAKVLL